MQIGTKRPGHGDLQKQVKCFVMRLLAESGFGATIDAEGCSCFGRHCGRGDWLWPRLVQFKKRIDGRGIVQRARVIER